MFRPDLSRLSPKEKDALILALLDRVAALEAKLARPPKTPDNFSVPLSRGRKANRPPRSKKPRRKREHRGVTRQLAAAADHVVDCHARTCMHCGAVVTAAGQMMRHAYDHIDLIFPRKSGSPSTCVVVPSLKRDLCSDGDAMEDR